MNKAKEYHRDIYSGIVAKELGDNGYFGKEYRLYGFLSWLDNRKQIVIVSNEEECAKIYIDEAEKGALLTPYISYGVRLYEPEKIEETLADLKDKVCDCLHQQYGQDLERQITDYNRETIHRDASDLLQQYYLSLTPSDRREKVQALRWLAGFSKKCKIIRQDTYNNLLGLLPEKAVETETYYKEISGFAWRTIHGWEYYTNAFLPTVVERMLQIQKQDCFISGIVSKKYSRCSKPIYELKAEYQGYLQTLIDDEYLNLLYKLYKQLLTLM